MQHSTKSLQKQAVDANIQVELTRRSLKTPQRSSTDERADGIEVEKMENLVVKNLIYSGIEPVFEGEETGSENFLHFDSDIWYFKICFWNLRQSS